MAEQNKNKQRERQVRIEIDDTVADGLYANLAFIASNKSEVIVDFARFLPGNTRGKVISRVIMAPHIAKNFLNSLNESIERYEKKFGTIAIEQNAKNIGFKINQEDSEEE
ncbi:hypothetical protein ES708_10539 [subsurface metagenome]